MLHARETASPPRPPTGATGRTVTLLEYYEGKDLRWAGKAGTGQGWTAGYLRDLRMRLDALATSASPFTPPVSDPAIRRAAKWLRPDLVVEVAFSEWTNDGHVRHPSVQGIRADKAAKDVVHETPASTPGVVALATNSVAAGPAARVGRKPGRRS